jgi:aspartokinase
MISTSAIRITCVVRESLADTAVVALHDAFKLEVE